MYLKISKQSVQINNYNHQVTYVLPVIKCAIYVISHFYKYKFKTKFVQICYIP